MLTTGPLVARNMFCAISGEIPDEPVVSRKSGHLFEKRVIEKALTATGGKCPETGQDLQADDLIEVKTSGKATRPLQSSASSFPGLLANLQSEWDSVMLENHQTKKLLNKTRQELAHSLYQFDAATRLVKKLLTEKDELQVELNNSLRLERSEQSNSATKRKLDEAVNTDSANDASMNESNTDGLKSANGDSTPPRETKRLKEAKNDEEHAVDVKKLETRANEKEVATFSSEHIDSIEELSKTLRKKRKSRKSSSSLEKSSAIEKFSLISKYNVPDESPCSSIIFLDEERLAIGTLNGKIGILNAASLENVETRDTSESGITVLAKPTELQPYFASGSEDGCVRVWDSSKEGGIRLTERDSSGVADLAYHPNNNLLFSCSDDGGWAWRDLADGKTLSIRSGGKHIEEKNRYRSGAIHPDGVLFATGCVDGTTQMWDIRTMKMMAGFETQNIRGDDGVTSLDMNENGYYLLAGINGTVVIWDLRNQQIAREFEIEQSAQSLAVQFDYSGTYGCGVSRNKHVIFASKKKRGGVLYECSHEPTHSKSTVEWSRPGIAWAQDAKTVIVGQADGTVQRYGREG